MPGFSYRNTHVFSVVSMAVLVMAMGVTAALSRPQDPPKAGRKQLEAWVGTSRSGSYLAGRFAARQRDYEHAARFFESTLSYDPSNPALLHRAFVLYASSGQWAKADALAARIVRSNPGARLAQTVLGLRAAEKGDWGKARQHFRKAAVTPVGVLTSGLLTAWTYAGEGNLAKALKALKKLDKYESFSSFHDFHGALIADYLKSPSRAEQLYARAYRDIAGSLRVAQTYANFLRRHGKVEDARKIYKAFLKAAPETAIIQAALSDLKKHPHRKPRPLIHSAREGMAEALFSLASALIDDRSLDIALIYDRMALRMRPDYPVAWMLLGEIYENMHKYDKAIAAYDRIPRSHPLWVPAQIQVALDLDDLKRTEQAIALLRRLSKEYPREYKIYLTLGNILRAHERWKEAAEAYSRGLKLMGKPQPRHWSIYYFRGIAYERSGEWPKAEKDFRLALRLNPDHPSVLNYLGYSLIDRGEKLKEALKMVKKAVDARPNDGYIVDSLGWAYYRLGRYKDAVKYLERAVELRPGDPVINDHLGDAYWKVGRRLEARFQWRHALDSKPDEKDVPRIERKLKVGLDVVEGEETTKKRKTASEREHAR